MYKLNGHFFHGNQSWCERYCDTKTHYSWRLQWIRLVLHNIFYWPGVVSREAHVTVRHDCNYSNSWMIWKSLLTTKVIIILLPLLSFCLISRPNVTHIDTIGMEYVKHISSVVYNKLKRPLFSLYLHKTTGCSFSGCTHRLFFII